MREVNALGDGRKLDRNPLYAQLQELSARSSATQDMVNQSSEPSWCRAACDGRSVKSWPLVASGWRDAKPQIPPHKTSWASAPGSQHAGESTTPHPISSRASPLPLSSFQRPTQVHFASRYPQSSTVLPTCRLHVCTEPRTIRAGS